MAPGFDSLKAALADRYRIERKIGQGGMATTPSPIGCRLPLPMVSFRAWR